MSGKMYYLTTLAAWQRHAHRFTGSHWIALGSFPAQTGARASTIAPVEASHGEGNSSCNVQAPLPSPAPASGAREARHSASPPREGWEHGAGNSSSAPGATQVAPAADSPRELSRAADENMLSGESQLGDATPILVLVEADEGAHLALESDSDFQQLPHPLAQKPIPAAARSAIAARGIAIPEHATTFETAESLARVHPLLRYRVF